MWTILERKGLVSKQRLGDDFASHDGVESMLGDQIVAFADDKIGVLGDLELLVAIMPVQTHARADNFQNIDDAERPIALVCA